VKTYKLKKGLDLPISGAIESQNITPFYGDQVAILGSDFKGMKPSLAVKEGDTVSKGQVLFSCKKNEGLKFCSRFDGKVVGINRGERRIFQSLVLALSSHKEDSTSGSSVDTKSLTAEKVRSTLIEKGEWCSLRERPFDKVAPVNGTPKALFVTAMDSNPLAPDSGLIIEKNKEDFELGLEALGLLTSGKTYVCVGESSKLSLKTDKVEMVQFKGAHPAGCPGTHMHFLYPVNLERTAWHIGYQDVIAVGYLFRTGELKCTKVVGLCGPKAKTPQLFEVYRGSGVTALIGQNQSLDGIRVISGSVLSGHICAGPFDFLGHYHNQVTLIEEDKNREFLGWQSPGLNKFSNKSIFLSKLFKGKSFDLGSSTHGSKRAMVPIGMFEDIMPLDILPTQLLRSLSSKDLETSQELGCLELAEEDLSLCTFVSPGKVDFGLLLRENLELIEKEL